MAAGIILSLTLLLTVGLVKGHGRLADPPSRNAMWMYGFKNPRNFDPNEMNCGGTTNHWEKQGGKCGLCGDPYQGPRKHEAGYPGGYANGIIGRVYRQGQTITVMLEITANHFGWFEFRLCPNNDPRRPVTQRCLDKYPLADRAGNLRHDLKHNIRMNALMGTVRIQLVLPPDVVCSQCVLQWFWYGGNSGNRLAQETFVNCADVAITRTDGTLPAGLKPSNIPDLAYKPIKAMTHRLRLEKPIDLEGRWDCEVMPPHANSSRKNVYKDWCIQNCLHGPANTRSCPVNICRCRRVDKQLNENMERQILGVKGRYPTIDKNGRVQPRRVSTLDGAWNCDVVEPYNREHEKRLILRDWCMMTCIYAAPEKRNCPPTHCECHRTDRRLSESEEKRLLQRVIPPRVKDTGVYIDDARDDGRWKLKAKIRPEPNGLQGTWDCDVKAPYNASRLENRLVLYEWCLTSCINADNKKRHCAETHCNCYRTDIRQSVAQIQAQLYSGGKLARFSERHARSRGIPPSLLAIFADDARKEVTRDQEGSQQYKCELVSRVSDREWIAKTLRFCYDSCVNKPADKRYCPESHCKCYDITNPPVVLRTSRNYRRRTG